MAFLHTIPYGGGESSIPPDSPHKSTSSTTATVPSPSIAKVRIIRRLHMYANRKSDMNLCRLGIMVDEKGILSRASLPSLFTFLPGRERREMTPPPTRNDADPMSKSGSYRVMRILLFASLFNAVATTQQT